MDRLRDLVRGYVVGRCNGFHLDQSNQSIVLEHRDQWSRRRTDHVCDDASDSESKADGTLRLPMLQRIVG